MNSKIFKLKYSEYVIFLIIYLILIINAFVSKDSIVALISAICGITYTILAGKGIPICYMVGLSGTILYIYLSFVNHLWGNLALNVLYYVPMQIIGFFCWRKNLKHNQYEIIKTKLTQNESVIIVIITLLSTLLAYFILLLLNDKNPVLDSITTVFSVTGMYLTIKRAIEQWYIWAAVNALSFIMWLIIAINGGKVYSTAIMWLIYLFLALYFYKEWSKEISSYQNQ